MNDMDILNGQYRLIIDRNTRSSELPFRTFCHVSSRQLHEPNYSKYFNNEPASVYDIKRATYEFEESGKLRILTIKNFGEKKFNELLRILNFYDQHVSRLLRENECFDEKLFYKDQCFKKALIEEQKEAILDYLFTYNNFIFGSLTDNQKEMIWKAISSKRNSESNIMLRKLMNVITNYTTTYELQNDVAKSKVLSRFVIK
ncbi:MAG TPA: hypothetical protein PKY25_02780 [Bacilli bacterium]|nr:hypothetical protein [Bacilli bacterium]